MTHSELIDHAEKVAARLGFPLRIREMTAAVRNGEIPDLLCFRGGGDSLLIECKVSRSDYLRDRKKPFRNGKKKGMGMYRMYVTAPDVVKDDLLDGWEHVVIGEDGNIVSSTVKLGNMGLSPSAGHVDRDWRSEEAILYSYIRRHCTEGGNR